MSTYGVQKLDGGFIFCNVSGPFKPEIDALLAYRAVQKDTND